MGIEHMVFSLLLRANSFRRSLHTKVKRYTAELKVENTNKCADGGAGSPIGLGTISTLNLKKQTLFIIPNISIYVSWSMSIAWGKTENGQLSDASLW